MSAEERPQAVLVNRCFVLGNDGKILIIKRSPTDNNNPSKWEAPGGKVDRGQALIDAREREVLEETGLLVDPVHRMAFIYDFVITVGKYAGLLYAAFFHITRCARGKVKLSDEHTEFAWVTYDEMLDYDLTYETRKAAVALKEYLVETVPAST